MRGHLTDAEMADGAMDPLGRDADGHLAECARCQGDLGRLRAAVAALAADVHDGASRPEPAWEQQRARIMEEVRRRRAPVGAWRWIWVPAAAVLAAIVVSSGGWDRGASSRTWTEKDTVLLHAVQRAIAADVPSALEPVSLLVVEMERSEAAAEPERGSTKGESS
jgi:hypothetical protein